MKQTLVSFPAVLVSLESGLVSEKLFGGQPYSRAACLSPNAGGETVNIIIPGSISGLTPADVAQRVASLEFARVKFFGLVCEVKGAKFNRVTYSGTAERAEVVTTVPAPSKS